MRNFAWGALKIISISRRGFCFLSACWAQLDIKCLRGEEKRRTCCRAGHANARRSHNQLTQKCVCPVLTRRDNIAIKNIHTSGAGRRPTLILFLLESSRNFVEWYLAAHSPQRHFHTLWKSFFFLSVRGRLLIIWKTKYPTNLSSSSKISFWYVSCYFPCLSSFLLF